MIKRCVMLLIYHAFFGTLFVFHSHAMICRVFGGFKLVFCLSLPARAIVLAGSKPQIIDFVPLRFAASNRLTQKKEKLLFQLITISQNGSFRYFERTLQSI